MDQNKKMCLRTSKTTRDEHKLSVLNKGFDVDNEYIDAIRTQSYVDFVANAQLFVITTEAPSSPSGPCKPLSDPLFDFFDISSEATRICTRLLQSINDTHANHRFIQRALDQFVDYSPDQYDSAIVELGSFTLLTKPFDRPNQAGFGLVNDRCTAIMCGLNSKLKQVKRRIKLTRFAKKASGVFLTVMIRNYDTNCCKLKFMRKLYKRLDVAAKGTYILNRDFDTISRLVARVRDEVEHTKEMIRYCLERREDRFPLQEVVKGLRGRGRGFKKLVEELEEHVCLCLATINRARVLVMMEMSKP